MNNNKYLKNTLATDDQKQRRDAQQQLAQEVGQLLGHSEQEGLSWRSTTIDLMEALHLAYETGLLQDEWGVCLSFLSIVRRACRVLHTHCPSNPYECASRGSRRKSRQMSTFFERYLKMRQRSEHPLWELVG